MRAVIILALALYTLPLAAGQEKVLNVYNWSDYIAADTISSFEKDFGVKVNYDLYDSTEIVEAKLLSGHTGYDVVFHSFRYSSRLIPIGVYQPLDVSLLPLLGNLDPWVLGMMEDYDPGNRFGIPYMRGTTGFAYNVEMIEARMPDAPVGSAAMLFDPDVVSRFADCGVSLLDEPTDVIPMVMLYLGYDPNSMDPAHMAAAEAQLKSVRPYIRYFSSAKMTNDLPNGEICVAMSWSGEYAQAEKAAAEVGADIRLAYTAPEEGSLLWFDGIFIPNDAPHSDLAHLFLNYLLRPDVIGDISNATFYANANSASYRFVWPEITGNAAIYTPLADRDRFDVGVIYGPKQERIRTRVWSRVKTGL